MRFTASTHQFNNHIHSAARRSGASYKSIQLDSRSYGGEAGVQWGGLEGRLVKMLHCGSFNRSVFIGNKRKKQNRV